MAKKTAAKKKPKKPPTQKELVRVFGECAFAIGAGAEAQAAVSGVRITLSGRAAAYWADRYWKTVPKGMRKAPWKAARPQVTMQARQLGVEAVKAAVARAGQGVAAVQILPEDVRPASKVVEHDETCVRAAGGGGGVYCQDPPAS